MGLDARALRAGQFSFLKAKDRLHWLERPRILLTEDAARTPKPTASSTQAQIRALPLSPVDGFVLSRIDGFSSEADLQHVTGLEGGVLRSSLEKLHGFGLITWETSKPAPPSTTQAAPPAISSDEQVDLTPEERERILNLHGRLSEMNHFEILGVHRSADRKEIKRAYYELAAAFHPDRFFRKRLGPYKAKLEALFSRMTHASEVLTTKDLRLEYDAYLGAQAETRALEERIDPREGREPSDPPRILEPSEKTTVFPPSSPRASRPAAAPSQAPRPRPR